MVVIACELLEVGRPKKRSAMVRFERNKERGKGLRGIGYVGFWMSVVVVFVGEGLEDGYFIWMQ